jgi:hypothetical protein
LCRIAMFHSSVSFQCYSYNRVLQYVKRIATCCCFIFSTFRLF